MDMHGSLRKPPFNRAKEVARFRKWSAALGIKVPDLDELIPQMGIKAGIEKLEELCFARVLELRESAAQA